MLTPVLKPWSGVSREWRTFRTPEKLTPGIFAEEVDGVLPMAGGIIIVATGLPEESPLLAGHVAHRFAALVAGERIPGWRKVEAVVENTMETLAKGHGLARNHHHAVANAHSGRSYAHPDHVAENLLAEYLLAGNVALHDAGGAVKVQGKRGTYTAYAQPGHDSRETLEQFHNQFGRACHELLDEAEGKILVG